LAAQSVIKATGAAKFEHFRGLLSFMVAPGHDSDRTHPWVAADARPFDLPSPADRSHCRHMIIERLLVVRCEHGHVLLTQIFVS
jgi:hypothetical protein